MKPPDFSHQPYQPGIFLLVTCFKRLLGSAHLDNATIENDGFWKSSHLSADVCGETTFTSPGQGSKFFVFCMFFLGIFDEFLCRVLWDFVLGKSFLLMFFFG